MIPELSTLIEMQKLDRRIRELRLTVDELPAREEELRGQLEEHRQALESARQVLEEGQRERRELEGEVEELRQRLSRYKTQLMEVKTNKEYQAMLHEIERTSGEISSKEDQVLEQMMAADEAQARSAGAEEEFREKEREIDKKIRELQQLASRSSGEIEQLLQEKKLLMAQIPEPLRAQYERIASVRNGTALAEARDQSCQACHVRLRPQLFAEIRANRQIITCESCNRILYYLEA